MPPRQTLETRPVVIAQNQSLSHINHDSILVTNQPENLQQHATLGVRTDLEVDAADPANRRLLLKRDVRAEKPQPHERLPWESSSALTNSRHGYARSGARRRTASM